MLTHVFEPLVAMVVQLIGKFALFEQADIGIKVA
jgi:hypothetical protein